MPMNANDMAAEIVASLEAAPSVIPTGTDTASTLEVWERVAGAIVAHIQANADVSVTVSVTVPIESGDSGLQASTPVGTATDGPLLDTSLDGTGAGTGGVA